MRILVCGDRHMEMNHRNLKWVEDVLFHTKFHIDDGDLVIQGECEGADRIAKHVCMSKGVPVCGFPAPWDFYGRSAGILRNKWMLNFGKPDLVIAFHKNIADSRGTKDMVERARAAGVKVEIVS